MSVQTINLSGYGAQTATGGLLQLGTWDSYGIEQLQIVPGPEWAGLTITATFVTPTSSTRMVVPESGLVDVPPEATAQALTLGRSGLIVFAGVSDGVQRISTNVPYVVADHAPVEGSELQPTPDAFAQLLAQYQAMLNAAVPPEGTTGYVLTKTDDGAAWQEPQGGGGTGADGGYYTPSIAQTEPGAATFSWVASQASMPAVPDVQLTLPPGENGLDGENGITPTIGPNGNWYLGTVDTGLPSRGEPGDPGDPGAAAGFGTPTISVDDTSGTPEADITASGPNTAKIFSFTFRGLKGKPGQDGTTPTIGENGNWFVGQQDTGKPSRGQPGPAYELTPEDQAQIVQAVLAALPVYNGEVETVG